MKMLWYVTLLTIAVTLLDDDGVLHLAKVAWRALASLEIYLEDDGR